LESVIADDVFLILHAYIIHPSASPVYPFVVFIFNRRKPLSVLDL
jgi:hypothetical protein